MHGRVETYIHGDTITANKGAAMVRISCQSEQGARTKEFKDFCTRVSRLAYGFAGVSGTLEWTQLVEMVGYTNGTRTLADELDVLRDWLKEEIIVRNMIILYMHDADLTDDNWSAAPAAEQKDTVWDGWARVWRFPAEMSVLYGDRWRRMGNNKNG